VPFQIGMLSSYLGIQAMLVKHWPYEYLENQSFSLLMCLYYHTANEEARNIAIETQQEKVEYKFLWQNN